MSRSASVSGSFPPFRAGGPRPRPRPLSENKNPLTDYQAWSRGKDFKQYAIDNKISVGQARSELWAAEKARFGSTKIKTGPRRSRSASKSRSRSRSNSKVPLKNTKYGRDPITGYALKATKYGRDPKTGFPYLDKARTRTRKPRRSTEEREASKEIYKRQVTPLNQLWGALRVGAGKTPQDVTWAEVRSLVEDASDPHMKYDDMTGEQKQYAAQQILDYDTYLGPVSKAQAARSRSRSSRK